MVETGPLTSNTFGNRIIFKEMVDPSEDDISIRVPTVEADTTGVTPRDELSGFISLGREIKDFEGVSNKIKSSLQRRSSHRVFFSGTREYQKTASPFRLWKEGNSVSFVLDRSKEKRLEKMLTRLKEKGVLDTEYLNRGEIPLQFYLFANEDVGISNTRFAREYNRVMSRSVKKRMVFKSRLRETNQGNLSFKIPGIELNITNVSAGNKINFYMGNLSGSSVRPTRGLFRREVVGKDGLRRIIIIPPRRAEIQDLSEGDVVQIIAQKTKFDLGF